MNCEFKNLTDRGLLQELSSDDSAEVKMSTVHPNLPHVAAVFREMVTAVHECHEVPGLLRKHVCNPTLQLTQCLPKPSSALHSR